MAVASKILNTIDIPCEKLHPWATSCCDASAGLFIHTIQNSFRIYVITYTLTLLMKGRKPTKKELKRTLLNILQSTAFLSCNSCGFLSAVCLLRRLFGKFNVLSVAFLPGFLCSIVAILIERPSRQGLLSFYATNVAAETFYNMMVYRGIMKPIPYGDLFIFGSSITILLYFFKGRHDKTDLIYSLLRFVVGPEENDYTKPLLSPQTLQSGNLNRGTIRQAITYILQAYCTIDSKLKTIWSSDICPHTYGCLYYILSSGTRLFLVGYTLQLSLMSLSQANQILRKPSYILKLMMSSKTFSLGAFLGGFASIYRIVSCIMRRFLGKDSKYICIPAGSLASLTYCMYRSNAIALYVTLKTIQIMYVKGSNVGLFPDLPQSNILFYCCSSAILFHAAVLEPHNLKPTHWKFAQSLFGEIIGQVDRHYLDKFGLKSSESLERVLKKYNPVPTQVFK